MNTDQKRSQPRTRFPFYAIHHLRCGTVPMAAKHRTFDDCRAAIDADKRAALEKLRKSIRAIVPKAEECVSYGLDAFRLDGKPIAGLGANATHCAFYPMSGSIVEALQDDLKNYETSKGAIRFPADRPLPAALVRKLVKARTPRDRQGGVQRAQQGRTVREWLEAVSAGRDTVREDRSKLPGNGAVRCNHDLA